ncbi:MAG: hypothetical protein JWN64_705 [Parcubacteria group bacterium]|nr:hypothetical protein [Parcubacteria group bacterium]
MSESEAPEIQEDFLIAAHNAATCAITLAKQLGGKPGSIVNIPNECLGIKVTLGDLHDGKAIVTFIVDAKP